LGKLGERYLFRIINRHFRLFLSVAIGLAVGLIVPSAGSRSRLTGAIIGYDVGAVIYLAWAAFLILQSSPTIIRNRALEQDDGKFVVLALAVIATIFATFAIFTELGSVRHLTGSAKYESFILASTTIVVSWFFIAIIFALHYAHDYYYENQHNHDGGLIFLPADIDPSYWDFLYFSFILSATAQTADVTLSSSQMRRTCTLHSILAFFFNTSLVALTVSMASDIV
jgi:uncharacterized membrane protein